MLFIHLNKESHPLFRYAKEPLLSYSSWRSFFFCDHPAHFSFSVATFQINPWVPTAKIPFINSIDNYFTSTTTENLSLFNLK